MRVFEAVSHDASCSNAMSLGCGYRFWFQGRWDWSWLWPLSKGRSGRDWWNVVVGCNEASCVLEMNLFFWDFL